MVIPYKSSDVISIKIKSTATGKNRDAKSTVVKDKEFHKQFCELLGLSKGRERNMQGIRANLIVEVEMLNKQVEYAIWTEDALIYEGDDLSCWEESMKGNDPIVYVIDDKLLTDLIDQLATSSHSPSE